MEDGSGLRMFRAMTFPNSNYLCHAPDITAANVLKVFSYNAVFARESNLSPPQQLADAQHFIIHL